MIYMIVVVVMAGGVLGSESTRNVHLKLGTDHQWSLNYDPNTHPKYRVRIEIECPVEDLLSSRNIDKSQYYLVNWFKSDKKLSIFHQRIRVDNGYLVIRGVRRSDSGLYYCEIITGTGLSVKSPKLELVLTNDADKLSDQEDMNDQYDIETDQDQDGYEPAFDNDLDSRPIYRLESTMTEFDCAAHGDPKPQVLWYKDDVIISEEDFGKVRDSMLLALKRLLLTDSGIYRCVVSNKFGQINRTFDLQVVETETVNQTMIAGETVILECPLFKDPFRSIKWFKRLENGYQPMTDRIDLNDEIYYELVLEPINYPPTPTNLFQAVNSNFEPQHLNQLVSKSNPLIKLMRFNDGSIVFKKVSQQDKGSYLCVREGSRQWSKRILIHVSTPRTDASFSQLTGPLVGLFLVVCAVFVLLGLVIKYSCERPPGGKNLDPPKKHIQPARSQTQINRLTSSPKNYEYYSNRWYSENRPCPASVANYANNYALVTPISETSNYFTTDRRMHLNPSGLDWQTQQSRMFFSTRSSGSYSRNGSLSASKSCSKVSTR